MSMERGVGRNVTYALFTRDEYSAASLVMLLGPVPKLTESAASTRILFAWPNDTNSLHDLLGWLFIHAEYSQFW
jgi:hypothetical protein